MDNSQSSVSKATAQPPPANSKTTANATALETLEAARSRAMAQKQPAHNAAALKSVPIDVIDLDSDSDQPPALRPPPRRAATPAHMRMDAETSTLALRSSGTVPTTPGKMDESVVARSGGGGGGGGGASAGKEEPLDVEDAMDPLSHLSSIFDKIRKQVIEWGEDANWKIDVFLLPNEDQANGSTPDATPTIQPSQPSQVPPPRDAQLSIPERAGRATRMSPTSFHLREPSPPPMDLGLRRLQQPPPSTSANMLPATVDERRLLNLQEADIADLGEAQAKRALSSAIHSIRVQRDLLFQYMQDLDSMQRLSAKRERDAEARLEVEKQIMERNALVLSKKWQDATVTLMYKDREMDDMHAQLETGKRLLKERNVERKKLFDEKGLSLIQGSVTADMLSALGMPSTDAATADDSLQSHKHRHRHTHYHRHHHRHLQRKRQKIAHEMQREQAADPFESLAALASEASMRDHVMHTASGSHKQSDYIRALMEADKRPLRPEDKDRGLQLRSVASSFAQGLARRPLSSTNASGYIVPGQQHPNPLLNGRGGQAGSDVKSPGSLQATTSAQRVQQQQQHQQQSQPQQPHEPQQLHLPMLPHQLPRAQQSQQPPRVQQTHQTQQPQQPSRAQQPQQPPRPQQSQQPAKAQPQTQQPPRSQQSQQQPKAQQPPRPQQSQQPSKAQQPQQPQQLSKPQQSQPTGTARSSASSLPGGAPGSGSYPANKNPGSSSSSNTGTTNSSSTSTNKAESKPEQLGALSLVDQKNIAALIELAKAEKRLLLERQPDRL